MLLRLILSWLVLTLAFFITGKLVTSISVPDEFWPLFWLAVVYGLINAVVGTVLRVITLPLTILTLGLSLILVNAALLWLTSVITPWLELRGFWNTIWTAIVLAVVSWLLTLAVNALLPERREIH
jgi:putative membrane protein